MVRAIVRVILPAVLCFAFCASIAQNAPSTTAVAPSKAKPDAKAEKTSAPAKTVKAAAVTINMPEGMTRDQAYAILNELRAIHQLLVAQGPRGNAHAPANAANNGPMIVPSAVPAA